MNWQNFGLNLNFSINGSKIKLISSTFQVTDYSESEKISKKIFDEIKKLSKSIKKIKPVKKEKIEQNIKETKKSSQSKLVWWISGVVGFVVLLMVLGSGESGGVVCKLGYANSSYCNYDCTKGDRYLWVPSRHPNPSAYKSYSNNGCPGWPPYFTVKEFDAAAK